MQNSIETRGNLCTELGRLCHDPPQRGGFWPLIFTGDS